MRTPCSVLSCGQNQISASPGTQSMSTCSCSMLSRQRPSSFEILRCHGLVKTGDCPGGCGCCFSFIMPSTRPFSAASSSEVNNSTCYGLSLELKFRPQRFHSEIRRQLLLQEYAAAQVAFDPRELMCDPDFLSVHSVYPGEQCWLAEAPISQLRTWLFFYAWIHQMPFAMTAWLIKCCMLTAQVLMR